MGAELTGVTYLNTHIMAEGKKSFVLYADYIHTIQHLTDEQAGKLLKHLMQYVNDQNPETDDPITKLAFEPIKQQLKRDLKHWESIKEKRSAAGKASAEKRKQKSTNSTSVKSVQQSSTNSTVNDNVNVNVINIPFLDFWNLYDKKVGGKTKPEKKWNSLKDEERVKIMETLPAFKDSISEKRYQPNPLTYLNNERWLDEIEKPKPKRASGGAFIDHLC